MEGVVPNPKLGAQELSDIANRIETAVRALRNMMPKSHAEAERLTNSVMAELATLDTRRANRDSMPSQVEHLSRELNLKPLPNAKKSTE
jgi:HPt (histidine-containing phosphotransfer) domain-containing protein